MGLAFLDWAIIVAYGIMALGIGIWFSKRSSKGTDEYFLSGRNLPWWIAGTSMVATTFAADTPLAITEFTRQSGIWKNWFWWCMACGGLLTTFLFAKLWRRARVLTDNELIELRYAGKPAAFLRAFKAIFFSTLYNFIVMGWVINGMATVMVVILGVQPIKAIVICGTVAALYCMMAGFWGVVVTDLIQFALAMAGAIALAVVSVNHADVGGLSGLMDKLPQSPLYNEATMSFLPTFPEMATMSWSQLLTCPAFQVLVFLSMFWWASHNSDGGGYIIQRISSTKDERHALFATLWFNLCHYVLRFWPWVIVALVSMVTFPDINAWSAETIAKLGPEIDPAVLVHMDNIAKMGHKAGYVLVISKYAFTGLKGLVVAYFLAAFMSTIDTHLNWGASYFINDIYRRFLVKNHSEKHYVLVSRIFIVVLMIMAMFIAFNMKSIASAWIFVHAMGWGIGLVLVLRWFWWRINAWSEISALATSLVMAIGMEVVSIIQRPAGMPIELFAYPMKIYGIVMTAHLKAIIIIPISILIWVIVTFATKPVPTEHLEKFYRRVRPGGYWGPVTEIATDVKSDGIAWTIVLQWLAGIALIYGALFGVGHLLFFHWTEAVILLGVAAVGALVLWKTLADWVKTVKVEEEPAPALDT